MVASIARKPVSVPVTLSDFRRIGKRKLGRSPADAKALRDKRAENKSAPVRPSLVRFICGVRSNLKPLNAAGIPLGSHRGDSVPACVDNRKKNWGDDKFTCGRSYLQTEDCGRYRGSWSGKTVYRYHAVVESWGAVVSPSHLYYRIDTATGVRSKIAKAPKGWAWNRDKNGIRLVNAAGVDYHPTASDLLTLSPAEIAGKARGNARIRRAAKLSAAQERRLIRSAESEGCRVCLADSVKSGNCAGGSINWGERHGLDKARHYLPSELLAMANGESRRVALAVACAMRRHRLEMARGFCVVAEHRA